MAYEPLTLQRLANLLSIADEPRRELLLAEFMEGYVYSAVEPLDKESLCVDEPVLVGDTHWDALIAGLAEYLAEQDGFTMPSWADQPERSSSDTWYYLDLPSARAFADVETPAPFRRRGVMIRPVELSRA